MKKTLSLAATCAITFLLSGICAFAQPFQPPVYYQVGGANSVVSGDFNKDGLPDFACLAAIGKVPFVEVFLNQGNGTFTHASTSPVASGTFAVVATDLNNDGFADLLTMADGTSSSTMTVYLGKGNGNFTPGNIYLLGQTPMQAVTADFNKDGNQDVAIANATMGGVMVFLGDGKGNLTHSQNYRGTTTPISLAAADLNGDGAPDLVVGGQTGNLAVLLNDGKANFSNGKSFNVNTNPVSIALADLNNDGKADAIVLSSGIDAVDVLLGNGDGTFGASTPYSLTTTASQPVRLTVGDYNVDGNLDVAVAAAKGGIVMVYGKGDGTLMKPFGISITGKGATSLVTADFNHDGTADLAASDVSNQIGVYLNEQ
jgi:hypothetical protein